MAVTDILETKIVLKDEFTPNASKIQAATAGLAPGLDKAAMAARGVAAAAGIAAVGVAAIIGTAKLSVDAMAQSAKFESLTLSLKAVEGSAEKAAISLKKLKEIAKAPGIGLEEAVAGYTGLLRNRMGDDAAINLIKEAGNANAFAGGNADSFGRMMTAFTQIAMKPNVSGEELMQLNDAGLAASRIITDKYGTADGGELARKGIGSAEVIETLVDAMEGMPRAAGGAQNAFDNLASSIRFATISFGDILNQKFVPALTKVGDEIDRLNEEGYFAELGESIAGITAAFEGRSVAEDIRAVADAIKFIADTAESTANFGRSVYNGLEQVQDFFKFIPGTAGWMRADQKAREESGMLDGGFANAQTENASFLESEMARVKTEQKAKADADAKAKEAEDAKPASAASQQIEYLKQIASNTKAMPEVMKTILGGGELGKFGVSATEIKGMGHARKAVKHLEIMGFGSGMSGSRKLARPGF